MNGTDAQAAGASCELTAPCTCNNGTAKSGLECDATTDLHQCSACDLGFYMTGTTCSAVVAPVGGNGTIVDRDGCQRTCQSGFYVFSIFEWTVVLEDGYVVFGRR